ncbi:hypothetical protein IGJ68_002179 [Enterococcus sp. DIV0564]|uniref:hypothetical protein n=1 Tax=Enterococcus sp. DIV2432 TaxID=2774762 RepID=UPI003D3016A6
MTMTIHSTDDSSILMIGELVLDQQLVIKDVCLCQNKYGHYYLRFPEKENQRVVHPISKNFYVCVLSEVLAEYHKKRSILGRKTNEKKDCDFV